MKQQLMYPPLGCTRSTHNIRRDRSYISAKDDKEASSSRMTSSTLTARARSAAVSAWRHLTVEPVIFLYLVSTGLNQVTRPNLLLQKACVAKLNYSQDFCDKVIYHSANETAMDQLQKAGLFLARSHNSYTYSTLNPVAMGHC